MALHESAANRRAAAGGRIRRAEAVRPAVLAIRPGAFVYGAGFARPRLPHDAARDVRRAFALPRR